MSVFATFLRWCQGGFVVIGVAALLFSALNVLAYFHLSKISNPAPEDVFSSVYWPRSDVGFNTFQKIYKTVDLSDPLLRYESSPSFAMHPILHYITAPIENTHYKIGIEGVRYQPGWSDDYVRNLLSGSRPVIFAFGGSTMMGHGVSETHTIPYFMNAHLKGTGATVLNFGSQAYDQHREIEKLVYLLRSGFRPKAVVFLDGWNDMFTIARSNMRVQDKITYHGFAGGRGAIAFTPSDKMEDRRHLRLVLDSLPLYRWLVRYKRQYTGVGRVLAQRDVFTQGFDFYEASYVHTHWAEFAIRNNDLLRKQVFTYYRRNLALLKGLSKGFGFDLHVFYQPFGLFDKDNPFVGEQARVAPGYDYLVETYNSVRKAISVDQLDMIDISQTLEDATFQKYLDVAHYAPQANDLIARNILASMQLGK